MGGYRKPSVRPMPRRLYRFTTERRTSVNRYLLTVDFPWPRRNQPNSPLLFFLRPVISPFVPSSFFSLSGHLTVCVCVCIIHLSLFLRSNIVSPSVHRSFFFLLASLALLASLLPSSSLTREFFPSPSPYQTSWRRLLLEVEQIGTDAARVR